MILAHGIGARSDLPVPLWLALYAAAAAVIVSFVAVSVLWTKPRLRGAAAGKPLPQFIARLVDGPATRTALQLIGVAGLAAMLAAAWFGPGESSENPAPTWLYVWFWLGMPVVSIALGPVYRTLNPLRTLAGLMRRSAVAGTPPAWAPIAGLSVFLWLELVFVHSDSPRVVALFVTAYAAVQIGAGIRYGDSWFEHGDGFAVYFDLVARLAPFGRRDDGALVVRNPLDGLVAGPPVPVGVVLVLLGATTFDGVTRLPFWIELRAGLAEAASMAVGTAGLAVTIALVAGGYAGAITLTKPYLRKGVTAPAAAFAHTLIPIVVGYGVAHYFSFAVFQGQAGWLLVPELFGGDGARIDYTVLSTTVIAAVQIAGIVGGHILAVVSAHDRAVGILRPGYVKVGQFPMLALMVVYTMAGIQLVSSS